MAGIFDEANKIKLETVQRVHASQVDEAVVTRDFEASDAKGRKFGARAKLFTVEYAPKTMDTYQHNVQFLRSQERSVGTHYGFTPHAMRGGLPYGASQGGTLFDNKADRDAAVEKYFRQAEQRALKNKARAA